MQAGSGGRATGIRCCLLLAIFLAGGCARSESSATTSGIGLRLDDDPSSPSFGKVLLGPLVVRSDASIGTAVTAAGSELERALAVWSGEIELASTGCADATGRPPILGRHRWRGSDLLFEPRFALAPGSNYTACADIELLVRVLAGHLRLDQGLTARIRSTFMLPPPLATEPERPRVVAVWPSSATVPENLLRLYVRFSEPMSRRDVASKVALIGEDGKALPEAFVEIPHGLWDPRSTRLTLLLHPGRIKRGVGPRERLGPVLRSGQRFRLRVDGSLASRRGVALGEPYDQPYLVISADRTKPDPEGWQVEAPRTQDAPLRVLFDEPLDPGQLSSFAQVFGRGDEPLRGVASVAPDGRSWSFLPAEDWREGSYSVLARRDIEDLAGNRADRLFDVETMPAGGDEELAEEIAAPRAEPEPLRLDFVLSFETRPGRTARPSSL